MLEIHVKVLYIYCLDMSIFKHKPVMLDVLEGTHEPRLIY